MRAALEDARRALLAAAGEFTESSFSTRPPGGGWCAGQVLEHLHRAESHVVRGARAALERGHGASPHWLDPLRRLPYRLGIADRVRVRTTAALDPAEPPERAEALARLAGSRAALLELLAGLEGRSLDGFYLRHPFFGALPLLDMVRFVAWHEDRHRRQIERIRRAVRGLQPRR